MRTFNVWRCFITIMVTAAVMGLLGAFPAISAQKTTDTSAVSQPQKSDDDQEQGSLAAHELALKEAMDKIFGFLEDLEKRSDLTPQAKQRRAIEFLRIVRYGPEQKDYFWINDLQGKMIMDPYIPDLVGKDLSDFADTNGIEVFNQAVKISRSVGEGFFDYLWPKYEGKQPVPKVAFVRLFEPWDWVIGTGIYRDTIEAYELPESIRLNVPLAADPFINDRDRVSQF